MWAEICRRLSEIVGPEYIVSIEEAKDIEDPDLVDVLLTVTHDGTRFTSSLETTYRLENLSEEKAEATFGRTVRDLVKNLNNIVYDAPWSKAHPGYKGYYWPNQTKVDGDCRPHDGFAVCVACESADDKELQRVYDFVETHGTYSDAELTLMARGAMDNTVLAMGWTEDGYSSRPKCDASPDELDKAQRIKYMIIDDAACARLEYLGYANAFNDMIEVLCLQAAKGETEKAAGSAEALGNLLKGLREANRKHMDALEKMTEAALKAFK